MTREELLEKLIENERKIEMIKYENGMLLIENSEIVDEYFKIILSAKIEQMKSNLKNENYKIIVND